MIRVVAPSRLHFGLFRAAIVDDNTPVFGGVGLMLDRPGVVVTIRPADSWQFEGPLASRAQEFAARFMQTLPENERRPFQVLVERCPTEHTGLGVGTQLGLAVAKALSVGCGGEAMTAPELARRVGRGARSAIGVHGFDRGGLIVDAGKMPGSDLAPLRAHVILPKAWRVVVLTPPAPRLWHGDDERAAFATAAAGSPERLQQLTDETLLPAAMRGDLDDFGHAVYEFNRLAGEPFTHVQGGAYGSREIASLIANVRACGVRGVGQSSWGPTVFALTSDADAALGLVLQFRSRVPAFVARPSDGHVVQRDPPSDAGK
jgi:beta-RFAP synthase